MARGLVRNSITPLSKGAKESKQKSDENSSVVTNCYSKSTEKNCISDDLCLNKFLTADSKEPTSVCLSVQSK